MFFYSFLFVDYLKRNVYSRVFINLLLVFFIFFKFFFCYDVKLKKLNYDINFYNFNEYILYFLFEIYFL
jgi:hypothetical protein